MFNNLIESSSHNGELKRRGSFFLFTVATYALLSVIAGVASIYAYDAKLKDQSTEISILTFPPPLIPDQPAPRRESARESSPRNATSTSGQPTRTELIDRADNPNNPPKDVGTVAPTVPPAPRGAVEGPTNTDPPGSGKTGTGTGSNNDGGAIVTDLEPAPTPAPTPVPAPRIIRSSTILNGKALDLPKPIYPPTAKLMRLEGRVNVQVLIDETGKVVSARALEGPPILKQVSEKAAYQARFSPTILGEQPVKVSGIITYNFVLQ